MLFVCKSDEYRTQHGEHICLYEGHQQFQCIHEQQHDDAEDVQSNAQSHAHGPAQEDDAAEAEYHGVASHHVGKETDHQREGLGEHAEQLDGRHQGDGFQEDGHVGPQNLLPVLLVAEEVDGQHGAQCQEERDVDITRHIRTAGEYGQQAQQVGD